ncbi:GNAT family N-acetyltransferase [Psychrobacillus lasiicapitis]|uniref:GNAT family N-acetyltransferase n=1 Tax=Psychrobacillus lasiicapitis TaxID=1636719 RepID=A0A544TAC0_9BACI|nr:GNAT family protein [Psychrobacillus lasiicapitis]TQR14336.1 GNAT family N-acetyltransferase [Psychrobacillus lasiicapitis]GGA32209.1 putative ribosomal-protein-alanine acetyltransferase [Psychrobacillus lasiicapitis]
MSNVYIRPLTLSDAEELLNLEKRNQAFFENYSITRPSNFFTIEAQKELIEKWQQNTDKDMEYRFGIFRSNDDFLIGTIGLFQVMRGPRQCAILGYSLDQEQNGKGYTTEAAKLVVNYAFDTLHLHRIEAGVMPHNIGSIRVLEKVGFHKEGIAKKNVEINGHWEDHQMLAIINPSH